MNTVSRMLNFRLFFTLLFLGVPLWAVQGTKIPTISDRESTWPKALSRLEQASNFDERKAAFKELLAQLSINQLQTDRALLGKLEEQIQQQAEESLDSELFLLLGQWKQKSTTLAMNLWQLEQAPVAVNQQRAIASREINAAGTQQEEQSRAPLQWAALLLIALAMTVLVMITKKYRNY